MRVVGVDLAAEPDRTAVAVIEWHEGKAVVEDLQIGADDEAVLAALAVADKAGIDAPFGWPDAFAAFLAAHQVGDVPVPDALTGQQWRRLLAWRHTDETVRAETKLIPLSVTADRIGHAAMRCAGLLAKLGNAGHPVNRDGSGIVAEVYPAAALKQWGLPYRGYKQPRNPGALAELATALQAAAPWLDLGPYASSAVPPTTRSTPSSPRSPLAQQPWARPSHQTPNSSPTPAARAGSRCPTHHSANSPER